MRWLSRLRSARGGQCFASRPELGFEAVIAVTEEAGTLVDDDTEKNAREMENILMALDQISQTIEVMTGVVDRLRNYVQRQGAASSRATRAKKQEATADRVLH
jgi:hypothetical protein